MERKSTSTSSGTLGLYIKLKMTLIKDLKLFLACSILKVSVLNINWKLNQLNIDCKYNKIPQYYWFVLKNIIVSQCALTKKDQTMSYFQSGYRR